MAGGSSGSKETVDLVPQAPKVLTSADKNTQRLIVVLSNACLETHKISSAHGDRYALLNCDDHQGILKKMNRDIADTRPDITHQVRTDILLMVNTAVSQYGLVIHVKLCWWLCGRFILFCFA
jgi:rRNA small subunit pseudouridine methyltransferase Nep1